MKFLAKQGLILNKQSMTNNPYSTQQPSFTYRMNGGLTPVVKILLIANLAVYVLELLSGQGMIDLFGLSYAGIKHGFVWQFFTYMFLHSITSFWHIVFNMLVLFMLGPEVERGLGTKRFLTMYVLSGFVGGVMWILLGNVTPRIGASGAVMGILGAFAALWPHRKLTLLVFFVIPVTIESWMLVCGLVGLEFISSILARGSIAHSVHIVGVAVGIGFTYFTMHGLRGFTKKRGPRLRVIKGGGSKPSTPLEDLTITQQEVDRLLDKIADQGMSSLTKKERQILELASRQRKR